MKPGLLALASALVPVCISVAQADEASFTFQNDTTSALTELHVAAETQQGWGPELLATHGGQIAAGASASITINDGRQDCNYVVFARWADNSFGSIHDSSIDMCSGSAMVQASSGWCSPDYCDERGTP